MAKESQSVVRQVDKKRTMAFGIVMLFIMLIASSISGYLFLTLQKNEEDRLASTIGTILSESIDRISFSGKYHSRLLLEEMQKRLPELAYISVETLDGIVEAHSDSTKNDTLVNQDERELSRRALANGSTILTERKMNGMAIKEVLLPYRTGLKPEPSGVIRIGIKVDKTRGEQRNNLFIHIFMIIVLTVAAIWIMEILSRYFSRRLTESDQALRESEYRYRSIIENIQDTFYRTDAKGSLVLVSPSGAKLLGYSSSEEMIGHLNASFWMHSEKRLEMLEILKRDGVVRDYEVVLVRKDGSSVPVSTTSSYYRDKDGQILGVEGIFRDITERKQAEESIVRERNFSDDIINSLPGVFYMFSDKGKLVRWNKKFAETTGYSSEELLAMNALNFFPPEHKRSIFSRVQFVFTEGESTAEAPFLLKNGRQIPYHFTGRRAVLDGKQYLVGVGTDITDRKLAEKTLRESEEKFKAMVETFPLAIHLTVGLEQRSEYLNPAMIRLFGYTMEDIPTIEQWWPLAYPDETYRKQISEEWTRRVAHALETQLPIEPIEVVVTCKDGSKKNISWGYITLGEKNYSCGLDLTERKRAEEEKAHLESQLHQVQKMESVGQLAGGVAHDFNNMLGVILGHAELAQNQVHQGQPLFNNLEEIRKAAQRSADITRQLLAFARKQTVAPKVLDLNETVEGMLKMLRRLIGEDINLAWLPGAGLWPVKMDPSQMDQILANLCVNARDAISGIGKMIVETGNSAFDEEYCDDHAGFVTGEYVRISVSDDGSGMEKETLNHIFEPFFTTKKVGEGTGLGLATVYGAVKQNNGFI
ncbi:MAG: PAS domain S-box protein, partial [Desulfoprunum sp.]|nr:PAS domain S-box protein [Desulfoprunum sp.]